MIILSHIFGLMGVLYAGPLADGLAFILATCLLIKELKEEKANTVKEDNISDDVEIVNSDEKTVVVTIAREYGSGGRYIGKLVSEKLGIKLYDKNFILKIAEETGLSAEYIEKNEQKRELLDNLNIEYYSGLSNADELFIKESDLIKKVADEKSCVIVGRCADFILKNKENVVKVFIYSDKEGKINRATNIYGIDKNKAEKEINKINKLRANHYKYYTEKEWRDPSNYDICINSDSIGVEEAAKLICNMVKEKATV